LDVQFKSPATDSGGNTITAWNWNFGDGATSTLQNPDHVYSNPGSFSPGLIVTNSLGLPISAAGPPICSEFYFNSGIVTNGGFETGDFTGWTLSGDNTFVLVDNGSQSGIPPHTGQYEAALGTAGTVGYLSQTVATTPGTSYALSCWLNDLYGDPGAIFSVSWNGTTLLAETNFTVTGWTNYQFQVSATGNSTLLQFGFADTVNYIGIDDVSAFAIQPSAPPFITGINLSGNNLIINGSNGVSGQTYYVLTTTNLTFPGNLWVPVATNVLGGDGNFSLTVSNVVSATIPQSFFRLQSP
jgi:PKD repeat protein